MENNITTKIRELKGRTEVLYNNLEMSYSEDVAEVGELNPTQIYIIENFLRKNRRTLNEKAIQEIRIEIAFWKKKYPLARIKHFFQFSKGTTKTDNQLTATQDAQNEVENICIYEKNPSQSPEKYAEQLLTLKSNRPYTTVLEAESEEIATKIGTAFGKGIKDFIIVGGKYGDFIYWRQKITNPIYVLGGSITVILPKRMHPTTKKSYIEFMIDVGVDFVVHGSIPSWVDERKKPQLLFLDENDMIYKSFENLSDKQIEDRISNCPEDKKYKLSRHLAVQKANVFAETHTPKIMVE